MGLRLTFRGMMGGAGGCGPGLLLLMVVVVIRARGVDAQAESCGDPTQFAAQLSDLNTECCKPPAQCPAGMPAVCTPACAFAFFSMDSSGCAAVLEQQLAVGDPAVAESLATLRSSCAVLSEDELLPEAQRRCGVATASGGSGHRRLQQGRVTPAVMARLASCDLPRPPPPPLPTGPVQAVGYSGMPAIDDSYETTLTVTTMSTSQPGYTTYRVAVQFGADAMDVYALFGVPGDPLQMPPAFQVPLPFGTHTGPINPAFIPIMPIAEFDSYLTIGIDGPASTPRAISSVGIDFDSWDETSGIDTEDGALFFMDPDHGARNEPVVFAQLTVPSGSRFRGRISAQGRSVGTSGPNSIGDEDWEVSGMTFDEQGSTGILRPLLPAGGGSAAAAVFAGTQLITDPVWSEWLVRQIGIDPTRQGFALCFSTFTDYKDDSSVFHEQCDPHPRTVVVARNALRTGAHKIFGGYAALPWNCANGTWTLLCHTADVSCALLTRPSLGLCAAGCPGGYCRDPAGADNFLFSLRPDHLYERYDTTDEGSYQWSAPASELTGLPGDWPCFGRHEDLNM